MRAGGGSAAAGRFPCSCSAFSETEVVDFREGCGESGETSAAAAAAAAAATAANAPEAAPVTPPDAVAVEGTLLLLFPLAFSAATMACFDAFVLYTEKE